MAFGLDSILGGVGDIAGYFAGSGDRDKAMQDLEKARKAYEGVDPNIKAQEAAASGLPAAGAGSRAAQMDALAALQRRYSQGGLDALTRARLARVQTDNSNAGRTAAAAAIEEANRRGTGAGGNAIVNAQVAGQQAANRNAQQTLDIAGQGEQLTAGATRDAANLAGQTRSQDYESAGAQDAINKFTRASARARSRRRSATRSTAPAESRAGTARSTERRWTRRSGSRGFGVESAGPRAASPTTL
jgi:hypothetical protein